MGGLEVKTVTLPTIQHKIWTVFNQIEMFMKPIWLVQNLQFCFGTVYVNFMYYDAREKFSSSIIVGSQPSNEKTVFWLTKKAAL